MESKKAVNLMILTLSIKTYHHQTFSISKSVMVDSAGGSIGRGADNTLVLEDPDQHISRVQVKISYHDDSFFILDQGRNASSLNGVVLSSEKELRLQDGDLLGVGAYIIAVSLSITQNASFAEALPAILPPVESMLDDLLSVKRASLDLLNENLFAQTPQPSMFSAMQGHAIAPEKIPLSAATSSYLKAMIPDDYDPLARPVILEKTKLPLVNGLSSKGSLPVGEIFSTPEAGDKVLQALLKGMHLPNLKTEKSAEEFAQLAGMMLREAIVSVMALLSRQPISIESDTFKSPFKIMPTFEAALTKILGDENNLNVSPVTALKRAFDDINTYQLAMEIQIQRQSTSRRTDRKEGADLL